MGALKEFKEFAVKGNVIDLAVGVVIGAAFGKIVSSLVADVIMPPIGYLIGGVTFSNLKVTLREALADKPAVTLNYGVFLQTIFDFLIIAWAIFMFVKVINTLKRQPPPPPPVPVAPPPPTREVELLTEIRDNLKNRLPPATLTLALLFAAAALYTTPSHAQAPATTGTTEVATSGFQAAATPPPPEDAKDATLFKVTAGGLLTQGNSRTIAATVSSDFRLRRNVSQFTALAAINYGRSAPAGDEPYETTVENYQGKVRYDYFFAPGVAGFLSVSARRDRFQGLDLRLNIDPGVAYYFIDEKAQQLWAELGYDLQHDINRDDFIDAAAVDPTLEPIPKSDTSHSVRAFVGYDYAINETLAFDAGLEYLQSVQEGKDARLNFDGGITTKISQTFSVAMTIGVRYDNDPLEGVDKTDLLTALNLVYSLAQ